MIRKLIHDVKQAITDHNRDFSERLFLILSLLSEAAALTALIFDIVTKEHEGEIAVLIATVISVPVITFTCMYRNKMRLAMRLVVTGLIFLILPGIFFFGGGIEGGGVLWIIFAFVYIGLVLAGRWRKVMLVLILLLTGGCYLIEYLHPEYVVAHSRGMFFIDSFVSIVLVGFVCFGMTWFQTKMLTDEAERARKEAERTEELTRSQNRFFSSMSHEIRTPINSILGLNELILRDTEASDEVIKDATGIQGAGKMLLALINDILDFSKIEAGSMDIVPVDYRVGDLLSDIVNMIWLRARDKGLEFNVNVDPMVPSVLYGDEVRVKQVIVNLLNNAVKYTAEGSVELHVESSDIAEDSVELSISVIDTGMGIKKEAIPYLFDAFKRVDEKKNRHIEGTGLGLSIVKQIVELMGGTVSVNSVYGEGSTFTAVIRQNISDKTAIGELNIHSEQTVKRSAYEAGFTAPEAKILIVDDNEMNIEVESKLLSATGMAIDKALSGQEALGLTLKKRYDTILMDHLMPEMDGVECLKRIRGQAGGLNKTTPVIVLTANAGSDNRDLYNRAGFDGYLVKPVSGESLENTLIKHIASDKLTVNTTTMKLREDINAAAGYSSKIPLIITAGSVCDLPKSIIQKLNIPIIPALIRTDEGVFKDGVQMNADELIRYMESGKNAVSSSMTEADYTEFFADALKRAHNLIHISIISSVSSDYKMASEAAKSFDNVTVINSGCLSSATGLLVLIAQKLAGQNLPVADIVTELEGIRQRLHCGFVVETTDYMVKRGIVSPLIHKLAKGFNLHPALNFKDDKLAVEGLWMGNTKRAYKKYIHKAFPVDIIPDPDILFITYVDVPMETLLWIKEEIGRIAYFENVVFEQASAAISSTCGPGTFGILYFARGNKSYNLATYLDAEEDEDDEPFHEHEETAEEEGKDTGASEEAVLDDRYGIEVIDSNIGIKNCGGEETFQKVLKLFYEKLDLNLSELNELLSSGDLENYTIKIHALKSSARLIGALDLGEMAQLLENAGKQGDISYIEENHRSFLTECVKYKEPIGAVFALDGLQAGGFDYKPTVDAERLHVLYEGLRTAADEIDSDTIDEILKELSGYTLPQEEQERYDTICRLASEFEYDEIIEVLP